MTNPFSHPVRSASKPKSLVEAATGASVDAALSHLPVVFSGSSVSPTVRHYPPTSAAAAAAARRTPVFPGVRVLKTKSGLFHGWVSVACPVGPGVELSASLP